MEWTGIVNGSCVFIYRTCYGFAAVNTQCEQLATGQTVAEVLAKVRAA